MINYGNLAASEGKIALRFFLIFGRWRVWRLTTFLRIDRLKQV